MIYWYYINIIYVNIFFKNSEYRLSETIGMIYVSAWKVDDKYILTHGPHEILINAESGLFVARAILLNLPEIP